MVENLLIKDIDTSSNNIKGVSEFRDRNLNELTGTTIGPFAVVAERSLTHGIQAVTNEVFETELLSLQGEQFTAITKVGIPAVEPRERPVISPEGHLGAWLHGRLQNEQEITNLLQEYHVPSPRILYFDQREDGTEVIIEEKIAGQTCLQIRDIEMPLDERAQLEKEKGKLLAGIHNIPVADRSFGPLNEDSMHFTSWQEYFNYKVSTTLSLLYGMYSRVSQLEHFRDLASSEEEWQQKVEHLASLYAHDAVQTLVKEDGVPTVTHGDYWDANIMGEKKEDELWHTTVIDLERGDISGRSFDLALSLAWKVGGDPIHPDPIDASAWFLQGYKEKGGIISADIKELMSIYALWQYLDFLVLDTIYDIDRTDESVGEINKLTDHLERIVGENMKRETISQETMDIYASWLSQQEGTNIKREPRTIQEVFRASKDIVIAGIKLPPSPFFEGYLGWDETCKRIETNIQALKGRGINGVVLDTTFDRPHPSTYNRTDVLDYYRELSKVAKMYAGDDMAVGLNMLLFDTPAALAVAKAANLDFVITDMFTDPVTVPKEESYQPQDYIFAPNPNGVASFRDAIGATDVLLLAGVNSKFFPLRNPLASVEDSIQIAVTKGADGVIVSNDTDEITNETSVPVLVMGGIKVEDLPHVKGKYFGFSAAGLFEEKPGIISSQKVNDIMQTWRNL